MFLYQESFVCGVAISILALHGLEACVGEILVADVLALHHSLESLVRECEDVVEDEIWREAQWCVAKIAEVAIVVGDGPILSTILR